MPAQDFARDLGYLDGFFTKLEAHAKTLGPAEGAELAKLIAEERVRWARIRALAAGAVAGSDAKPAPVIAEKSEEAPRARAKGVGAGLTVGSLIGR